MMLSYSSSERKVAPSCESDIPRASRRTANRIYNNISYRERIWFIIRAPLSETSSDWIYGPLVAT